MNDICNKLYRNTLLNVVVRNLNIGDIEDLMNSIGINAKNNYNNPETNINYSKTLHYDKSKGFYPDLYQYEIGAGISSNSTQSQGIDVSDTYANYTDGLTTNSTLNTDDTGLTVTQTFYGWNPVSAEYFNDANAYSLLFSTGNYWLSSRSVYCSTSALFSFRYINNNKLDAYTMIHSNGYTREYSNYLRPIVIIDSNTKIQLCNGNNSENNKHTIIQ